MILPTPIKVLLMAWSGVMWFGYAHMAEEVQAGDAMEDVVPAVPEDDE